MFAVSRGFSSDVGCAGGNARRALWLRLLCHGQWPSLVCCLVWAIPLNWRPCTPLPGWRSRAPRGSSKASAGGALPLPLPASPAGGPALWLHLPGSGPQITWPSKTSCTQISVCLLLIQTFVTPFQAYLEKTNSLSTSRFCPSSLVRSRFCHIREYLVSSDCDLDFLGAITQLTTASKRPPGGPLPPHWAPFSPQEAGRHSSSILQDRSGVPSRAITTLSPLATAMAGFWYLLFLTPAPSPAPCFSAASCAPGSYTLNSCDAQVSLPSGFWLLVSAIVRCWQGSESERRKWTNYFILRPPPWLPGPVSGWNPSLWTPASDTPQ